jgi:diguanylate cyclase (GGDEF)-like protein/PAS domain S-box-containing protein
MKARLSYPAQLALIYALLASLWILFSDLLTARLFRDPQLFHLVSSVKGLLFVAFTTALLFGLARRLVARVELSIRDADRAHLLNAHTQRLIAELLNSSPDAIFTKDRAGRYTLANREVARVTGRDAAQIIGKDDRSLFPADQAVMQGDVVLQTEEHLATTDGRVTYLVTKGPLHGPDGQVNGIFGIARDVTEREQTRERLAEMLATLRESQVIAGIGSYLLEIDSGAWSSSDILDRLFGIDDGYDHSVEGWVQLLDARDRESMARYLSESVLGQKQAFDREYRIIRQTDQAERWVHGLGVLELDDAGRPIRMRGTIQDITDRVRTEATLRESESRFRALVEQSMVGIYIIQDGKFRYVNPGFAQMHGYASAAELIDQVQVLDLVAEEDVLRVSEQINRRLSGEETKAHYVFTARHKDGRPIQVEVYGQSFVHQGHPAVLGLSLDITARKKAEEELRIAAIAFEAQDGIMVTDAKTVIQRVNKAFTRITGYSEQEAIGNTPRLLQSGHHDGKWYGGMWEAIVRDGYWQGELCNRRKDSLLFTERLTISAVKDPDGAVTHYVGSLSDVTRQREAESQAQHLAYFDALTDLPNRRLLYDRLEHALSWSARGHEHCALLFIDLDNFKRINDTIGHRAGDGLLVQATQRMKTAVREGDTVARFGGDEFVVLLEDLGSDVTQAALHAGQIGEKLRKTMADQYEIDGHSFYCTASLGVTLFIGRENSIESILMHADLAMYKAKEDGRNTLRFFEETMQTELAKRTALESELRIGMAKSQFVLYYQPQLDRASTTVGAEALLRWNHPQRGLLFPAEFIPLAEDSGLIVPLGQWVLDSACARISAWATSPATRELVLAVNVSARQFAQENFVEQVLQSLQQAGADPSRLKIEITESMVLADINDTFRKMGALKSAGITFSLDDFGTGSSSLSYLTRLPLDQIKIDKSFVDDLPDGVQDAMVAQTIITMARGLGLNVVAKGVETDAQWEFLMRHGCDTFQGFRFGTPVEIERFEANLPKATLTP